MTPVTRPAGADDGALVLVDATSGAGGLPVDVSRDRRLLLRPAEGLRLRRRAVDRRCVSPAALDRVAEIAADRTGGSRRSSTATALDNTHQGPDATTPRRWRRCSCWPTRSTGCNGNGGLDWAVAAHRRLVRPALRLGGEVAYATPFVADPALRSQVVGTIDFADSVDAAAVAKTLRANGIVDTEPYRKLGRNQLRIGMFPAVDPDDVEALTACIDYVVEKLGLTGPVPVAVAGHRPSLGRR